MIFKKTFETVPKGRTQRRTVLVKRARQTTQSLASCPDATTPGPRSGKDEYDIPAEACSPLLWGTSQNSQASFLAVENWYPQRQALLIPP